MSAGISREDALARLEGELQRPPFNRWIAARPLDVDVAAREVMVAVPYRSEFSYDPIRHVFHGGVIATIVDVVGYASVAVWHGAPAPTVSLQVEYLGPAECDELHARGILRKLGRSIARADIEVTAAGKLVALGRGTFSTAAT